MPYRNKSTGQVVDESTLSKRRKAEIVKSDRWEKHTPKKSDESDES